ncbi:Gfo/Idh/MocA family protein [Ahrensia sp. 13_GOM-1096m]|uniref:Gfo/Idh/MocA family protein n=1 Tax=Ahrensia sp. 13_GOM-1096m TaxID=1380380 RepID=UPI00047B0BFD|nr:Gfo/Idh/MocA family oxidoreductase [Ahrensia sp. 13_GOM-1096m]
MTEANKQMWNWGIIGTGAIAQKFASDLSHVAGAKKAAIFSRTLENANDFASKLAFAHSYDNLQEFLAQPDLDIVYIATPHIAHREQALAAIKAGKAVLIEKPIAMTSSEVREIKTAASEHNVLVMEALWSRFLPAVQFTKAILQKGDIGAIKRAEVSLYFERDYDPSDRLYDPALGGGVLHDLGVYPISLARYLLGELELISSEWKAAPNGVNKSATLHLKSGAVPITINVGFGPEQGNTFDIYGEKGALRIDRHFLRTDSTTIWHGAQSHLPPASGSFVNRLRNKFSLQGGTRKTFTRQSHGLNFQAAAFQAALGQKSPEHPVMPLDESAEVLHIIEQVLAKPASA